MKKIYQKLLVVLFFGVSLSQTSVASAEDIKWKGTVKEASGYHSTNHSDTHQLEFTRESDNKSFDIVDSDALEKLHAEKDKNLLVEVEGEITPRFLFWGGNLKIKSFTVLEELETIPHRESRSTSSFPRETGSLRRNF